MSQTNQANEKAEYFFILNSQSESWNIAQMSQTPANISPNANEPIKWLETASDYSKFTQITAFLDYFCAGSNNGVFSNTKLIMLTTAAV
jgi:hypothetical protein